MYYLEIQGTMFILRGVVSNDPPIMHLVWSCLFRVIWNKFKIIIWCDEFYMHMYDIFIILMLTLILFSMQITGRLSGRVIFGELSEPKMSWSWEEIGRSENIISHWITNSPHGPSLIMYMYFIMFDVYK